MLDSRCLILDAGYSFCVVRIAGEFAYRLLESIARRWYLVNRKYRLRRIKPDMWQVKSHLRSLSFTGWYMGPDRSDLMLNPWSFKLHLSYMKLKMSYFKLHIPNIKLKE